MVAPGHSSHGASAGVTVPTKGYLLGSQTRVAAGVTAAPALYFPTPISPILASRWRLVTGSGDGDTGVAAHRAWHPFRNKDGAWSVALGAPWGANTRNGAGRSACPHGREMPGGCELPASALIFPIHKSPCCLHQHDGVLPMPNWYFSCLDSPFLKNKKHEETVQASAMPQVHSWEGVHQDITLWDGDEKGTWDSRQLQRDGGDNIPYLAWKTWRNPAGCGRKPRRCHCWDWTCRWRGARRPCH